MKKGDGEGRSTEGFGISRDESVRLIVRTCLENGVTDVKQIAYVLATAKHETKDFKSPEEDYGRDQARILKYRGGEDYYGRGYAHLTHNDRYEHFDDLFGMKGKLVANPNMAMEPKLAAKILVIGMRDGGLAGPKLDKYINEEEQDFYNARRVVNGVTKKYPHSIKAAEDCVLYAKDFEKSVPKIIKEVRAEITQEMLRDVNKILRKSRGVSELDIDGSDALAFGGTGTSLQALDLLDPKGREKFGQSLAQANRLELSTIETENLAMAITHKCTSNCTIKQVDDMIVTRGNAADGGDRVHFMFKPNGDRDPIFNDYVDLNTAKATPAIESAQQTQKLALQIAQEQSNLSATQSQNNGPVMKIGGLSIGTTDSDSS